MTPAPRLVAALAAAVTLVSCSGNDDAGDVDRGPDDRGLRDAVQAYSDAFLTGDGDAAYELLSARCQDRHDPDEWSVVVSAAGSAYGEVLEFTSYEADISDDMARVTYTYEQSEIDQQDEPWVYEDDSWRQDDC